MTGFAGTRTFLDEIGKRLRRRGVFALLLRFIVAAAVAALIAGLWANATRPSAVLGVLLMVALAAAGAWAWLESWQDLRLSANARRRATYLGMRVPALASDVRTTVELAQALAEPAPPRFSVALAAAHADRTAERLRTLDARSLVPWGELRAVALIGGAVCAAWIVGHGRAAEPALTSMAIAVGLREPPLRESAEPLLGDLRIDYRFPSYTRRAALSVLDASGDVRALRGTEVQLQARTLKNFKRPIFRLGNAVIAPTLRGDLLTVKFVVDQPGTWQLETTVEGERLRDRARRIDIEPDTVPTVDLAAPEELPEITPATRLPFAYRATDDYGVTSVELVWKSEKGAERRRMIWPVTAAKPEGKQPRPSGKASEPAAEPDKATVAGQDDWEVGAEELEPGAMVSYWLEARDNDTISGPKLGRSRVYAVRVSSPEQKHDASIGSQEQAFERAVAQLADRLELRADLRRETVTPLHERMAGLLDALAGARKRVAQDPVAPRGLPERLGAMYARLEQLFHQEASALDDVGRLTAQRPRHILELERDVIELDDWITRQRLEGLRGLADEIAAARKKLKELLAQYAETRDEAIRREIERLLGDIESRWRQLMARASQLHGEMPDEYLNRDALENKDLAASSKNVRSMLEKGNIEGALAALDAMGKDVDRLLSQLNQGLQAAGGEQMAAEDREVAEIMDRLADLEATERQLVEEAAKIDQHHREAVSRATRGAVEELQQRIAADVDRLARKLGEVDRSTLPPFGQETLDRALQRAEETRDAMAQGDLHEALQAARGAADEVETVRGDAEQWNPIVVDRRKDARATTRRLEEAAPMAEDIVRRLESVMPRADELVSPDDRQRLRELAGRQQEARNRAEELGSEMARRAERAPALDTRAQSALGEAKAAMDRATRRMQSNQPSEAHAQTKEAAERLASLRQQMGQRNATARGQSGSRERVQIPDAEQYRAPREWREEIMDAMKQKAPPAYREKVKSYYQELIR